MAGTLGHYELWKGNIHHRDISASNLMYYRAKGVLKGILNDYGLATLGGLKPHTSGDERTETIPFMAIDLWREYDFWRMCDQNHHRIKHQYRYDVESFVWVFTWISCQYKDGKFRDGYFAKWAKVVGSSRCAREKLLFLEGIQNKIPSDLGLSARFRVIHYTSDIYQQLRLRKSRDMEVSTCLTAQDPALARAQMKMARLEEELKEKEADRVFRKFAAVIGYADVEAVIQRAAKSGPELSPGSV